MIDHVSITVSDLKRAGAFYDAIMATLGHARVNASAQRIGYGRRRTASEPDGPSYISIVKSDAVAADRRHWAFTAVDCATVAAFHGAALKAGGHDDGSPGLRPSYHAHYFAAFVRDPDGNRLEAVCHRPG